MDRKIVFRAWYQGRPDFMSNLQPEEHKPQMIYRVESLYNGSIINGWQVKPYPCLSLWMHFGDLIDNPDFILMQFTGVFDKNERAIYEGDIMSSHSNRNDFIPLVVDFEDGGFVFKSHTKQGADKITQDRVGRLVVIGNIYEHLELLTSQP